jgi:pyridoxamine 5'-phosphate oxidase
MTTDPHPHDPHAWATSLEGLYAQVWQRLARGVVDRHAPARHPTFATVSPDGWPEARTVVMRAADPAGATLDIHTDLQSAKVASLRANPRAALHIWEASAHLQIRLAVMSRSCPAMMWPRYGPRCPTPRVKAMAPRPRPASRLRLRWPMTNPAIRPVLRCCAARCRPWMWCIWARSIAAPRLRARMAGRGSGLPRDAGYQSSLHR